MSAKRRSKEDTRKLLDWAKTEITKNGLSQVEAAKKTGLTPQTISKYYREEQWDKFKRNFMLTREEQMGNLLEELEEMNAAIKAKPQGERFANAKEGDARRKLVKDIADLETKASIPEMIHAFKVLLDFARKADLEKAQELAPIVDACIKSKL